MPLHYGNWIDIKTWMTDKYVNVLQKSVAILRTERCSLFIHFLRNRWESWVFFVFWLSSFTIDNSYLSKSRRSQKNVKILSAEICLLQKVHSFVCNSLETLKQLFSNEVSFLLIIDIGFNTCTLSSQTAATMCIISSLRLPKIVKFTFFIYFAFTAQNINFKVRVSEKQNCVYCNLWFTKYATELRLL